MFYKAARAIGGFRKLSRSAYSKPQKKLHGHFGKALHHVSAEAKSEAFSETRTDFIHPTAFVHPDAILGHVSQDIPRYMMVAGERAELRGLNLEGLRRHGFSSTEVKCMRRAYRKIFLPNNEESAQIAERLAEVEKDEELSNIPVVCFMVQSIRDSFELTRRGICKFRQWNGS